MLCLSALGVRAFDDVRVKTYYVDVNVHANNTIDITEEVTVHFGEPRHGFFRYVPYKYYMFDKTYVCDINNVKVYGDDYTLSDENDNLLIKIGDANRMVSDDKTYGIEYTIVNKEDRLKDFDIFYHSIVGNDFQLDIDTLMFSVVFEKKVPQSSLDKLNVYSGPYGVQSNELNVETWMEGDTIYGCVTGVREKNAVTLQMVLPEGYYEGVESMDSNAAVIWFVISMIIAGIIIFFALTLRRPVIISSIEYYPPEGICSAEVGTIVDGTVDPIDLGSMIPWFASKGYVMLEEVERDGLFRTHSELRMTKLKDLPDTAPNYQRTFFNAMFSKGDEVMLDDMPEVPEKMNKAKEQLSGLFKGEYELTNWHNASLLMWLLFVTSTLSLIYSHPFGFDNDDYIVTLLIFTLPFICGATWIFVSAEGNILKTKNALRIRRAIRFVSMAGMCYWYNQMCPEQILDQSLVYILFVVCFVATELLERLNRSTPFRAEMMCKLLGLKEYIELAEKPQLEMMLNDDPNYFFNILPYALVLNVSDVWAEHFKDIKMETPDWYRTTDYTTPFVASSFVSSLASATDSAITCMSPKNNSSSDSYSGGFSSGSSGGGGGGGGGGAW